MTLEELQLQADKDLKINDSELDLESLKTPQLHNTYMKHLTKFKLMLSKAEAELNVIKREKWEYYTGKAPAEAYAKKPFNLKLLRQDLSQGARRIWAGKLRALQELRWHKANERIEALARFGGAFIEF